jgi:hypothetical protein
VEQCDESLYELCKSASLNFGLSSENFSLGWNLDAETQNHLLRVCLYSIAIANSLGIHENRYWMKNFIEASLKHDCGKAGVEDMEISYEGKIPILRGCDKRYHFVNKETGFTQEDRRRMNNHIDIGIIFFTNEEPIKSISACHHLWQKNPVFPAWLKSCKRTKETDYLSKLLAIVDCYDAASERINTRNSHSPRKLEHKEAIETLLQEYGNLQIVYRGHQLPKIRANGEELINYFCGYGIFKEIKSY